MNNYISRLVKIFILLLLGCAGIFPCYAEKSGQTAGLLIGQNVSPRASALGDAFTAVGDDIAAFHFNPASLASLHGSQLAFQRKQGAFSDDNTQLSVGTPLLGGAAGFSARLYDTGKATLYDGTVTKSVTAEKDYLFNMGYGFRVGNLDVGGNLRYLSSTLADEYKGTGSSMDLGVNLPLSSKIQLGLAGTAFATKIDYGGQSESLPKIYRVGASYKSDMPFMSAHRIPFLFLADAKYSATEKKVSPSIGLEGLIAEPLALRLGYKFNQGVEGFTVGFGFFVRNISIDYSFGVVSNSELDPLHTLGLSVRFGKSEQGKESVQDPHSNTATQAWFNTSEPGVMTPNHPMRMESEEIAR